MEPQPNYSTYKVRFTELLGSLFLLLLSIFFLFLNFSAEMRRLPVALVIYNTLAVLFAAASILLLLKLAGNTVLMDSEGITQKRLAAKPVRMRWEQVKSAQFKPNGDFLCLRSEDAVIYIYPKMEGIHDLLRALRDNLDEELTYKALNNLLNSKYIKIDKKKK